LLSECVELQGRHDVDRHASDLLFSKSVHGFL